jgi:hypothetical protein
MSKALLLLTLSLTSAVLSSKSSLQYLQNLKDESISGIVIDFIDGLQVFNDIPCPDRCDIDEVQAKRLLGDLYMGWSTLYFLMVDPGTWYRNIPKLKELATDLYKLYGDLSQVCDGFSGAKQRIWEIEGHVSNLEYIPKLAMNCVVNYQKLQDQMKANVKICEDRQHPEYGRCAKGWGTLLHDVFLWDFKH